MFYIGAHSTNDLFDGYMGSGVLIRLAIKHYGEDYFEKEVIKMCTSVKGKWFWERKLLTREVVKNPQCYNLITGGKRRTKNTFKVKAKTKNCKELLNASRTRNHR